VDKVEKASITEKTIIVSNQIPLKKFIPQPYEILGYSWILISFCILKSLPIYYPIFRVLNQSLAYFGKYLLLSVSIYGIVFVWRRTHRNQTPFPFSWGEVVQISLLLIFSMAFHFMLKSCINLLNPRNYDALLFRIDRSIHFGIAPAFFFVELFKSKSFYRFMDVFYSPFYYLINITYVPALIVLSSPVRRRIFAAAYILVCIFGLAIYTLVPSWGPVFSFPETFENALQQMPITVSVQKQLYKETVQLIRNPMAKRSIQLGGIAAFPSLHLALLFLFALASKSVSRKWFHLNLIFLGLMMIGTVVTGYHYLIDDYAGLLLGWSLYKLAGYCQAIWDLKFLSDKTPD
jgi:membrane-associated phospholipid phosphatase